MWRQGQWPVFSGTEVFKKNGLNSKTLYSWWKRKIANRILKIDFVKHIFGPTWGAEQTIEDEKRFVTFALDSVNLSTVHRTRKGEKQKVDDKAPRILGPSDKTIHTREEGPTVQLRWQESESMAIILSDRRFEEEQARFKKHRTHGGKGRSQIPSHRRLRETHLPRTQPESKSHGQCGCRRTKKIIVDNKH